jgi:hypothetical protein
MAYMLPMTAGQISHPVAYIIQMISDDRLVHGSTADIESVTSDSLLAGE